MYRKICRGCKIEKDETDFHKRTASPDGLDTKCKICRSVYIGKIPTGLKDAPEKDKKYAEEILRNMGFELYNPDRPVWKQFNERMERKYGVGWDNEKKVVEDDL